MCCVASYTGKQEQLRYFQEPKAKGQVGFFGLQEETVPEGGIDLATLVGTHGVPSCACLPQQCNSTPLLQAKRAYSVGPVLLP